MYFGEDSETAPQGIKGKMIDFKRRAVRVLKVSVKPTKREYWMVAKITGAAIVLIGIIGFIIGKVAVFFGI